MSETSGYLRYYEPRGVSFPLDDFRSYLSLETRYSASPRGRHKTFNLLMSSEIVRDLARKLIEIADEINATNNESTSNDTSGQR